MRPNLKSQIVLAPIDVTIILAIVLSQACQRRQIDAREILLLGEPDRYSATVVRIVDDGTKQEVNITRELRSGDMRREEWNEQGRNRALICGLNLENAVLLDLDAQTYVEVENTNDAAEDAPTNRNGGLQKHRSETAALEGGTLQAIDQTFDEVQSPDRIETRMLASEVIDGYRCSVYEQRLIFPDGHTEVTKSWRADDLSGLALRIENTSEPGGTKVITERRDVRTDIPADAFVVPPNYKKAPRY